MDHFPAWKARLVVRFEDFGSQSGSEATPKGPRVPTTALKGLKSTRSGLEAAPDPGDGSAARRFRIQKTGGGVGGALNSPQERTTSADGMTHVIEGVIPYEAKLELNGLLEADSLEATFAFEDLPFLPETIRSCAVEFYAGVVSEEEAAQAGFASVKKDGGEVTSMAVLSDTFADDTVRLRSNLRFQGWADTWQTIFPDEDVPRVTLKCRDNTALLIDQDAPPSLALNMKLPLSEMFATYLANFPQLEGLVIEYRGIAKDEPVYEKVISKSAYRPQLGPVASKGAGSGKSSVWDVLTDYSRSVGHIVRIIGSTLVVQTPVSAVGFPEARPDDPFGKVRKVVMGRTLSSATFERTLGGKVKAKNIEARCYVPDLKKTIVKRYPEDAKKPRSVSALPGDGPAENKYTVAVVYGIKDEATVLAVAKAAHQLLGRAEVGVSFTTINLCSYEGQYDDPDMLDMQAGDPVLILRAQDAGTTQGEYESDAQSEAQLSSRLQATGHGVDLSNAYARAYVSSRDTSVYRLRKLTVHCSTETGIDLAGELSNYVILREDPAEKAP